MSTGRQSELRKGRRTIEGQVYHVTTTTFGRTRLLENFQVGCAVARCLNDPRLIGHSCMLAWVLMPDHAHWLLKLGRNETLGKLVNRLKSCSARHANRQRRVNTPFWARGYHDHALRSDEDVHITAKYIIANPLRAGMVESPGDYPFWDVAWNLEMHFHL